MNWRRFLGLAAPKFCRYCGQPIIHGSRTVHLGYDEETGTERKRTTQEWWCPWILGDSAFTNKHQASYRHG
jgi:hypothetical protein